MSEVSLTSWTANVQSVNLLLLLQFLSFFINNSICISEIFFRITRVSILYLEREREREAVRRASQGSVESKVSTGEQTHLFMEGVEYLSCDWYADNKSVEISD